MHFPARGHYGDPATAVFELSHVAGPVEAAQKGFCLWLQNLCFPAQLFRRLLEKILHQSRDVLSPLGQLGNVDANYVQAMEQVLSESPLLYQTFQILMGRGNNAHIDLNRYAPAYPIEFSVSKNPQQSGLGIGRHISDLIEEQSASIGLLKTSLALVVRAGESPFFVTK